MQKMEDKDKGKGKDKDKDKGKNKDKGKDNDGLSGKKVKLLGQGGFGCVYYRGFSPNGTMLSGDYITKITMREKGRENDREARIGKIVSKLPRYDEFFAAVIKVERVDLANVDDAEHLLMECDIVNKKINHPDEKFQLMTQLYVPSVTFVELASKSPSPPSNFSNLLNTLISCREHLLLGIARLQNEALIVHFDIKSENVVFNTLTKNPVIIDFGLSFVIADVLRVLNDRNYTDDYDRVTDLRHYFYGFFPDYSAWPIEVHIICYIVAETRAGEVDVDGAAQSVATISSEALKSLVSAYISGHLFIRYQSDAYKTAFYERSMAQYGQSAVGRPGMDVIRDYVKDWKHWDLYAASVLFLDVLEIARHSWSSFPAAYATQVDAFSESLQRDAGFIE
jgi:hypothetical protein